MGTVALILTNFARPKSLERCLSAWREQTVKPDRIIVVDQQPAQGCESYPRFVADDVWKWRRNSGCSCWLYPALDCFDCKYILHADDDLIPDSRALEHLLSDAETLNDQFATLGHYGRMFLLDHPPGQRYSGRSTPVRRAVPTPCHLTCRLQFTHSRLIIAAFAFRESLCHAGDLVRTHDDMLLSLGAQMASGYPSYISGHSLVAQDLDDDKAVWRRPQHFAERARMVDLALEAGWRPIWHRGQLTDKEIERMRMAR